MALPFSRNTTYTTDTPTRSSDLNMIQDCVIGRKHGVVKETCSPRLANNGTGWEFGVGNGISTTGPGLAIFEIPCMEGDEIHAVEVIANGNGSTDVEYQLRLLSDQLSTVSSTVVNDADRAGGSYGVVTITPASPFTVPARHRVVLHANASASGYIIGTIVKVFAKP